MSDTENTQNQLSNIEAEQIELLTERIISNKPSDAEIIYNKRKRLGLTQKEFADKITNKQYIIKNGGHINSETGYTKFEEILKEI